MNFQLARLPITIFTILITMSAIAQAVDDMQVRVFLDDKSKRALVRDLDLDVVWEDKDYVDIITSASQVDGLRQAGFRTETIHESVGEFYRSRLEPETMGGYKTLSEIYAYLDGIIAGYPDLVSSKLSIGTTIEGRDIWAVKVSDNPNVDEDEPEVLYTAAIHSREMVTPEILFHFMDHLTTQYNIDPEVRTLVDNREIWFILVCNPDGYYYNQVIAPYGGGMWRKNRRDNGDGTFGIDLNRNWGYMWGYDDVGSSPFTGSETYRGTGPFSEPETQAFRDFITVHDFVLSVFWHSYSNIFIFPWGYIQQNCPDDDIYRALGDSIQSLNGYTPGLAADLLYPANGGSFDWEYGEQTAKSKVFGTTIEAGSQSDGFWPTLARAQQMKEENLPVLTFLTRLGGNIYSLRPPEPPEIVGLPTWVDGTAYDVNWIETDPANPAALFELVELTKRRVVADPAENLNFWQTDKFSLSTTRAYSGTSSIYSGSGDLYTARLTSSHPYTVKPSDQLRFRTYFELEFYVDFAYVLVSTDGQNFNSIPGNLTTDYNPYGTNRGNGITSASDGWVEAVFDLTAYDGQQVWFRFACETDASNFGEGWYLDDIYPHVIFDSVAVIATDLTSPAYHFADRPMGVYYYQVRALDNQGQWGSFSSLAETDVLGSGIGDIDLDGNPGTVADLTLLSNYFEQGLAAFRVYPAVQAGETDINCDGMSLTSADLNTLSQIVLRAETPCYGTSAAAKSSKIGLASVSAIAGPSSLHVNSSAVYAVALESTSFPGDDTVLVDIVLTETTAFLLGFQFHLEYDAGSLILEEVRRGDAITNWQFLDHDTEITGAQGELTVAGVSQYQGGPIQPEDIDLQPTPARLIRLKFSVAQPGLPLDSEIKFIWSKCGDNTIAGGHFDAGNLVVDSLALSRLVSNADGLDITGLDPRYGGADYTCFYGMFGGQPVAAVDFASSRVIREPNCCVGLVGDVNGQGGDEPTIGDVSMLIDHLFLSGAALPCLEEADVNQSGGAHPAPDDITIGDVSTLIDHLFISSAPLLSCP